MNWLGKYWEGNMILRRLGNKKRIAHKIIPYFPPHKVYIEPFFGAGGMFFQKPKAKYNIVNDLDSDVFNLFQVVMNQKEELIEAFKIVPIHSDLLDYWKKNKEIEPVMKALRFLFLSNFTLYGKGNTIQNGSNNNKQPLFDYIERTFEFMKGVQFANKCYKKIPFGYSFREGEKSESFIYADPPYLGTTDNYSNSFKQSDTEDLFKCLIETGCKFAISEFKNPIILDLAKQHNLQVIEIGERRSLKNRNTEILIVNYPVQRQKTLFN